MEGFVLSDIGRDTDTETDAWDVLLAIVTFSGTINLRYVISNAPGELATGKSGGMCLGVNAYVVDALLDS